MNDAYRDDTTVDPQAIAEFNRGTTRAITANRAVTDRERELDHLEYMRRQQ